VPEDVWVDSLGIQAGSIHVSLESDSEVAYGT
jgi:Tfp pilus assembly protein PilN